ncbi:OmpH family outer membrane protein [Parapedomonas caeni]|jgi:Skp family chaperone for outer membrane proteins
MKTHFLKAAAVAAVVLASAPAVAQQASVLVVNLDRVVNESAAGRAAGTELKAKAEAISAKDKSLAEKFKTEEDALTKQKDSVEKGIMQPAQFEANVRGYQERRNKDIQDFNKLRVDFQRSQAYVVEQITAGAAPIIQEVMRERGASLVVKEGALEAFSNTLDITSTVVQRLDQKLPKVSTTPPPAPAQPATPATPPKK